MKRKGNIYNNLYDLDNILNVYKIIKKNTKNKDKIIIFEQYFSINIYRIYKVLKDKTYEVGKYNKFIIYEPKERLILSQNLFDKIINHLVAYELINILDKSLINSSVATRKNKGTSYAVKLLKKYINELDDFYYLKIDIKKYFYNIDHDILKQLLLKKIKDKDFINIVFKIIDSTNSVIEYDNNKGLPIGSLTSQILGIYYLNEIDHFIKEDLKIKYYIRYLDDFLIIHEDKEYLKYCLDEIRKLLNKYKLVDNNKTCILSKKQGICFLGYRFSDKQRILSKNKRRINKKLKLLKKYDIDKYNIVLASYKGYFNLK